ncbi:MAG: hypothetical protein WEF50_16985 [Myxococcota bacterium]
MDHRRVQRALFRMQLDPEFARRLRAGDAEASRGLGAEELRLLRGADPSAVSADRDGRRRAQFLSNVSSELPLSIAVGFDVAGFTESNEFHDAVQTDASLPLALARYAHRCSGEEPRPLRALLELEGALARARREPRLGVAPRPGEVVLAAWVFLETLPSGTLALAERVRAAIDADTELPALVLGSEGEETLLVRCSPETSPFRLRAIEVERTSPALAGLLRAACEPASRAALAAALSCARSEIDPIVDELVDARVLLAG